MIRYNIFILINFLILFCISCIKTVAFDYNLDQFLYPNPGVRNVYKGLDGDRMEIIGISSENKILDIQETIYFSKKSLPPDIPNSSTVNYKIIINNQKMIKQSMQTEEIILLDPKTQGPSKWKITGKMGVKLGQGKEK